jgi:primosomal protein N'
MPFFDAEERVFINFRQLLGRARQEEVDMVIQTFIPENTCIKRIVEKNYKDFFLETLEERKMFHLPPFSNIAILEYRTSNTTKGKDFSTRMEHKLKSLDTQGEYEIISSGNVRKKYNQYYYQIHIKGLNTRHLLSLIREDIIKNPYLTVSFA